MQTSDHGRRRLGPTSPGHRNRTAFSLLELILVITIVSLLNWDMVPRLTDLRPRADHLLARRQALVTEVACREYRARHGRYPQRVADLVADGVLVPTSFERSPQPKDHFANPQEPLSPEWMLVPVESKPGAGDVVGLRVVPVPGTQEVP